MTRERVSPAEWRRVVVIGLSYFFISSILALFRPSSPATAHLLSGCILVIIMGSFISNASLHRNALASQTDVYHSLNMRGAVAIAAMLKRRIRIFEARAGAGQGPGVGFNRCGVLTRGRPPLQLQPLPQSICVAYTAGSMLLGLLLPTLTPSTLHAVIGVEAFELVLFTLLGSRHRGERPLPRATLP